MGISLATLADRLARAVPPRDDVPGDYEQLCREAVQQLSTDVPIVTTTTLLIVAGTANYALPADFLYEIDFAAAPTYGDVLITTAGIVPLSKGWTERWYVEGANLRLEPVPTYSAARLLKYAAAYTANADGVYQRLSENGARVALLYAQHLALAAQAQAAAGDGWSYKIGDESVDKRGLGAAIQAQAQAALGAYEVALRPLKGYGAHYRQNPYAAGVEV